MTALAPRCRVRGGLRPHIEITLARRCRLRPAVRLALSRVRPGLPLMQHGPFQSGAYEFFSDPCWGWRELRDALHKHALFEQKRGWRVVVV